MTGYGFAHKILHFQGHPMSMYVQTQARNNLFAKRRVSLILLLSTGLWHGKTSSSPSTCPSDHAATQPTHQTLKLPWKDWDL